MNRKAMEPITIVLIIIGIVAGFLVVKEVGLFVAFTPNVGQPNGTDSLVNQDYYPAIENTNYGCESPVEVLFRTSSLSYGSGSAIAYYDSSLIAFGYSGGYGTYGLGFAGLCDSAMPARGYIKVLQSVPGSIYWDCASDPHRHCSTSTFSIEHGQMIPSLWKLDSNTLALCEGISGRYVYVTYSTASTDKSKVSISQSSVDSSKEITQPSPIKDLGKFACLNGDVYQVFCNNFSSQDVLQTDCLSPQSCQFLSNQQIPDGIGDIVKCSGLYKPATKLCSGNTLFTTSADGSSITPDSCGYICSNGACIECQDGIKRCSPNATASSDVDSCIGGNWVPQSTKCLQGQFCVNAVCTSDVQIGQKRCLGNQPQVVNSNYVYVNDGASCDTGCTNPSTFVADCEPQCDIGYSCGGGALYQCTNADRDNELSFVGNCISGNGQSFCNAGNTTCGNVRSVGDKYCSNNQILKALSSGNPNDLSGGITGNLETTCTSTCQPNGIHDANCTLAEGCSGKGGLSICLGDTRKTCSQDSQSYTSTETCSTTYPSGFCKTENNVGVCKPQEAQCSIDFCSGGNIFDCNNGQNGDIINKCSGLGCYNDSNNLPRCNDECSNLGAFKCESGDSYQCLKNTTTNQQMLEFKQDCGSGCNLASGQCNSVGTAGSYVCAGINNNQVYQITANQGLDLIATCGAGGSYCSPGVDHCKFCEQGALFCKDKQQVTCSNEETGATTFFDDCPAGCFVGNQNSYCDKVELAVTSGQNFLINENVILSLALKGSQSKNGLETTATATITGDSNPVTSISGPNGILNFGFGIKALGPYTVTVNIPEYNRIETINVKVSNDYKIRISSPTNVILLIPGTTPKIQIEAKDASDNAPSSISLVEAPSGISVDPVPTQISGRWDLLVNGEPGIYKIKLKPANLESQEVTVELRKPVLKVDSNIPASEKVGQKQYDITVKGPLAADGVDKGIVPDSIESTVTANGQSTDVTLKSGVGGIGSYLLDYNFATEGAYVINVDAVKDGYETATESFTIQISKSGSTLPPGSSGNSTCTDKIKNGDETGTDCGGSCSACSGVQGIPTWVWIAGGIGVIWFVSRRKR